MNEKRVTLPPLAAGTPNGEAPFGSNIAVNDNSSRQRLPLQPGQDGYVTPTEEKGGPNFYNRHSANASSSSLAQAIREKLQWRERIRHYTWTFFAMTMATGGIANVLYTVPFRFHGLTTIGVIFFLLNIVLFIINIALISLRFHCHPGTFKLSIIHPTERLFIPAAVVSLGTVLLNISQYGPQKTGSWLNETVRVCYWIYCALAVVSSMGIYLVMWSTASFTISQMTPIWIFPAYPLLVVGPHSAVLSKFLPQQQALNVIVGGFTLQGIGFLITTMIYSAFMYRLMTQKLPEESSRPGMFVSVGPSGFTVGAILGMADNLQRSLPPNYMGDGRLAAMILKVVASWMSLWIWGLALWFFFVSIGAHWSILGGKRMPFTLSWFSFVFPNTALVTSTFAIGKAFNSKAIKVIGCVMTVILIAIWFAVVIMMIRAVKLGQILWPQKGEDRDEGGFKGLDTDTSGSAETKV